MNNNNKNRVDQKSALFYFVQTHDEACINKHDFYIDPQTSYQVMTSYFLKNRGYCCNNNCRHCPYKDKTLKKGSE